MKNIFILTVGVLFVISCSNSGNQTPITTIAQPIVVKDTTTSNKVFNTSFVSSTGEKFLHLELTVDTTLRAVWDAFTTVDGIKAWMSPVTELDFRIGGTTKNNLNKNARIGDKGTITLGVINYIPWKMITYKVDLTDFFDQKCRKEDGNLQEVIQFVQLAKNKTKIISNMVGWGTGPEWDKTYGFFDKGNIWSYDQLIKRFTKGPLKW